LHDKPVTATADRLNRARNPIWGTRNRATTVGMLVIITMAAFESLGVSTAMPRMLAALHGNALYSWPFTAYLAASLIATVLSGRLCDRLGPAPALLTGPALFLAGLLVAGSATGMLALLAGRALQGFGGGTEIVAIYVLVALVYPERSRPRVFGLIAAAWVVPSLVGPTVAGLLTEHVGWRWVFLGLTPLPVLGFLLLWPALRRLPAREESGPAATPRRGLPVAAVATGLGISALTWAVQHPSLGTLWLGLAGLAGLVAALPRLLPRGTLTARRGLPVTILARGLFAGSFGAVEAFLPLTLVAVHHQPSAVAGLPLTVSSLGWAAASHWQGRYPDLPRALVIRLSYLVLAVVFAAMTLVAPGWGPWWLAFPLWVLAGAAMGLAYPGIGVLMLEYAAPQDRGFASAALQVSDMAGSAMLIGIGGVFLTTLASAAAPTTAVITTDLLMAAVALLGAVVFRAARGPNLTPAS
jgi:MFS family permease